MKPLEVTPEQVDETLVSEMLLAYLNTNTQQSSGHASFAHYVAHLHLRDQPRWAVDIAAHLASDTLNRMIDDSITAIQVHEAEQTNIQIIAAALNTMIQLLVVKMPDRNHMEILLGNIKSMLEEQESIIDTFIALREEITKDLPNFKKYVEEQNSGTPANVKH